RLHKLAARCCRIGQYPQALYTSHCRALRAPHLPHGVELLLAARAARGAVEAHQHPLAAQLAERWPGKRLRREELAIVGGFPHPPAEDVSQRAEDHRGGAHDSDPKGLISEN